MPEKPLTERGNILFIVLLMVILFVGLNFAVRESMRSGGNDITDEQAKSYATTMLNTGALIENGLQRFLVTTGYTIDQIDLYRNGITQGGDNPNCNSNACNLFDPAGGNIPIAMAPKAFRDLNATTYFPTGTEDMPPNFSMQVVNGVGTSLPDVILAYNGISRKLCAQINIMGGLRLASDPVLQISGTYHPFQSVIAGGSTTTPFSPPGGARVWCWERTTATHPSGAIFNYVIYAR